jgi:hypothetical protein
MKSPGPIKETVLLIYLVPLGLLVAALDLAARACKWGYKTLHAAATVVSAYIREVMDENNFR